MLHEQQKESSSLHAERAFLMRDKHQEALKKSVMLRPASQTSRVMQNVHDKPRLYQTQTLLHFIRECGRREGVCRMDCKYVWVWKLVMLNKLG